LIETDAL
jgi:hypothetical protein